ncbi:threonine ammonia-lyase IlvA [Eupransor demetentiae]|uniref:L-threonine dehydratase n=1 Tax=Eupransor demetentiae TaxID=3109584 RepID=A0ABP0ER63_9LACO|nr:Threonine deaminase (IlvA) [Lactobacillaceae bacterium LMG 33000]
MTDSQPAGLLSPQAVLAAYQVLKKVVKHTPLEYNPYLSQKYDCRVYLKREDLQEVRSFKIRGAYYAIMETPADQRQKGVVCASAGNHAQGVAWTSHQLNIPSVIFMPTTTPKQKVDQVKFFGQENAKIQLVGDTFDAAQAAAFEYCDEHHLTFIPPFDDLRTMAGQGSLAVEIFNDAKDEDLDVDYLLTAVGGGGLISGVGAYTKSVSPQTKLIGVEPAGAASMDLAFKESHPTTLESVDKFVDGAAVKTVGQLTYQNAKQTVDQLVAVPEGQVCSSILELYSKCAIVAEPAGALSVAALEGLKDELQGKTVVCVVSGGNNDIDRMQEIKERSLIYEGYQLYFLVNFPQRAGALKYVVNQVLQDGDDINRFEYTKKMNRAKGPVLIGVQLGCLENKAPLLQNLAEFDPHYINLEENHSLYEMLV